MLAQNLQKYITEYENIFQLKIFETLNKLWLFAVGILLWAERPACWRAQLLVETSSGPPPALQHWGEDDGKKMS